MGNGPSTVEHFWQNLTASSGTPPSARGGVGLGYDASLPGTVLFGGGGTAATANNDTWCYCSGSWVPLPQTGSVPSPRSDAAVVPYPADRGVLLFGGLSAQNTYLNDTWVFNATGWTNVTSQSAKSPPARFAPAVGYDAATGLVVLFGGADANVTSYNDTWTYSNGSWTPQPPGPAPPPREQAAFAPDPGGTALILFGGYSQSGYLADTWSWSNGHWTLIPTAVAPPPMRFALFAQDLYAGYDLLFGGFSSAGQGLNATWAYASGRWANLSGHLSPSPSLRWATAMTFDAALGDPILFGGCTSVGCLSQLDDTWGYDASWLNVAASVQPVSPTSLTVNANSTVSGGFGSPYNLSWDFGTGAPAQYGATASFTYAAPGTYTVTLNVTDAAGVPASQTVYVTVQTSGLAATLDIGPDRADVNTSVVLQANVTRLVWPPAHFAWQGLPPGCSGSDQSTLACRPTSPGTFTPSVNVSDSGQESVVANGSLTVYPELQVSLASAPATLVANSSATFTATVHGGDGAYTTVWAGVPSQCSARGSTSWQCNLPPGSYSLSVTVNDTAGGRAAAYLNVTLSSASPVTGGSSSTGIPWYYWAILVSAGAAVAGFLLFRRRRPPGAAEAAADEAAGPTAPTPEPAPAPAEMAYRAEPPGPEAPPPAGPSPGAKAAPGAPPAVAPPAEVAGSSLPLSSQILLHLYRQGRLGPGELATVAHTQEGIGRRFGRPQSSFARALARLREQGLVEEGLHHVAGKPRRLKAYRLTARGEAMARQMDLAEGTASPGRGPPSAEDAA